MVEIGIERLTRRFGKVTAVDDVSLVIREGELFFLLGPSGCGKTTLLRMLAGFLKQDAGSINFSGRCIDDVPAQRRNCAMVFQNYALWPHMTVFRNVRYSLDVRQVPHAQRTSRVEEMLGLVRMSGYEERFPDELSGGQQQRVALARALVVKPDVVLLDEPLSNLDAKLRLEMRSEIRRIHRSAGQTSVYVTHDQKEALSMADRIALMNEGKVVQVGTPEEIYTRPASLFAARFIGNCSVISGRVRSCDASTVQVETPVGLLAGRPGADKLAPGDSACIAVRPELFRLVSAQTPNSFDAIVASRMYLGEMVQFQLHAGDLELSATALGQGDWPRTEGAAVRVAFDAADALVFGGAE